MESRLIKAVALTAVITVGAFLYVIRWNNGPRLISSVSEDCVDVTPVFFQQQTSQQQTATDSDDAIAGRKPLRMIRDPNAAYSAVAVDTSHNEVVLTDENLFNVLV